MTIRKKIMKMDWKRLLQRFKKSRYFTSNSLGGKVRIALALMGIIPFLLMIYLFFLEKISLSNMAILFSAVSLFSILTGFTLLKQSADQLAELAQKTEVIVSGKKSESLPLMADEEINVIARSFNAMLKDLKEQSIKLIAYAKDLTDAYEIHEKEVDLRNRLIRYVREDLVEKLINSKTGSFFENERKEVTVLFADIRSFTNITDRMPAEEVVAMLNQFFSLMVNIIFRNNGVLDKFVGDNLMALFGFIPSERSAPADAIRTAIEMQDATEALMQVRKSEQQETFEIGIGINTGVAIVGNVGCENRIDYTVIGDCVNIASKLEEIAQGGEIIIGEPTYREIKEQYPIAKHGEIRVKNNCNPVKYFHVLRQDPLTAFKCLV